MPQASQTGDLLRQLNVEQRHAVEHADGPLLVLAGPGCGKTRVITHRIAYRISSGQLPAHALLGITFTTRAAQEMRTRVQSLLGEEVQPKLGTFHWMCHGLLRKYIDRIHYPRDFRLLTPSGARNVIRGLVMKTDRLSAGEWSRIGAAISAMKNGAPSEFAARRHGVDPQTLSFMIAQYDRTLHSMRSLDLDDLLRLSAVLLREDEQTRQRCRRTYREILVDEYQDTNTVQQELLSLLAPDEGIVVAVGDQDQSIYGWRQADAQGVHRFLQTFSNSTVIRLHRSYRSTKHILRAASRLVEHNPDRLGPELATDNPAGEHPVCYVADDELEEAEWVAAEIERLVSAGRHIWKEVAILYRVNSQSRALEDALVRHRVPYHIHAGARFYERPEIRRVVAYLRLALDFDDEAAVYLASEVPGVASKRLQQLREAGRESDQPLLNLFGSPLPGVPRTAVARLAALRARGVAVRVLRESPLSDVVSAAIRAAAEDTESAIDGDVVTENLDELRSIVQEFDARKATLRDFIDRLSLADASEHRSASVILMTLHAAKGLEYPVVFVVGLEEGLLPHRRSLDREEAVAEERRLCYVGMTRARTLLYMSYAHGRMLGGHAMIGHPSRFIAEMGAGNLSVQISPKRAGKPRLPSVLVGERVTHSRWHAGTVIRIEGKGRETLVTIEFDGGGRQRLQLCHAPLTRFDGERANVRAN